MMLTHAQLLDAVRAAGRGRESFTCADVRQQLGISTSDRKQLNRFYSRFRALQADAASQVEKLANNCYRLRVTDSEAPAEESLAVAAPAPQLQAVVVEPEAPAPALLAEAAPTLRVEVAPALQERAAPALQLATEPALLDDAPGALAEGVVELVSAVSVDTNEATSAPAAEVAHAKRRRTPWWSRMTSFFGRRSNKSEVTSSVAIGA